MVYANCCDTNYIFISVFFKTTITMVYKRDLDEIKRVKKKNGHLDNLTTNIKNSHPYVREV